jgi:hypothetical protein
MPAPVFCSCSLPLVCSCSELEEYNSLRVFWILCHVNSSCDFYCLLMDAVEAGCL